MPTRSFYIKDSELDEYQIQVIQKRSNHSFIVKGCAGSGKSILALWKVKQIQEEKMGSYYFIVFTKTLKQYMKDGISAIGLNDERILYHRQWESMGCPSADFIIVDEAQDFAQHEIEGFMGKAKKALILYGDSAQQIYNFRNPPPLSIERIGILTDYPSEQLVFNHRLPKKIARFAQYLSNTHDELEARCKFEGTELPKILRYSGLYAQLDAIAEIVKARNFLDVGVFLPTNKDVETAFNYLSTKGVNVERKSKEGMDLNFKTDNIKIVTFHSSKGLQFEAVFIPECHQDDYDKRSPLYVAITRSYQSLYIMHSGNLSPFFDVIPKELYETTLVKESGIRL